MLRFQIYSPLRLSSRKVRSLVEPLWSLYRRCSSGDSGLFFSPVTPPKKNPPVSITQHLRTHFPTVTDFWLMQLSANIKPMTNLMSAAGRACPARRAAGAGSYCWAAVLSAGSALPAHQAGCAAYCMIGPDTADAADVRCLVAGVTDCCCPGTVMSDAAATTAWGSRCV